MRVLRWIVERVEGRAGGELNPFGMTPRYEDLDWSGLDFDRARYEQVTDARRRPPGPASSRCTTSCSSQLAHRLPAELPRSAPAHRRRASPR